jgi:mannose-6-phosphate isomerase-like protein (cupin superfamily)
MDHVRLEALEPFVTLDGSSIRELANTDYQSLAEATVPPGGETEAHFHRTTEELYFFTAGAGRMKFGDEIVEVAAGECVTIPPGIEHRLWNTSDSEPLVLLCCCAPGYSHEDTVVT